jgi:hypothetical protein
MIQGGEQNHKDSRILPKPYRSNNYKRWKKLLKKWKKGTQIQNTKPRTNQTKASIDGSAPKMEMDEPEMQHRKGRRVDSMRLQVKSTRKRV